MHTFLDAFNERKLSAFIMHIFTQIQSFKHSIKCLFTLSAIDHIHFSYSCNFRPSRLLVGLLEVFIFYDNMALIFELNRFLLALDVRIAKGNMAESMVHLVLYSSQSVD